jgi:hypothetical protein
MGKADYVLTKKIEAQRKIQVGPKVTHMIIFSLPV